MCVFDKDSNTAFLLLLAHSQQTTPRLLQQLSSAVDRKPRAESARHKGGAPLQLDCLRTEQYIEPALRLIDQPFRTENEPEIEGGMRRHERETKGCAEHALQKRAGSENEEKYGSSGWITCAAFTAASSSRWRKICGGTAEGAGRLLREREGGENFRSGVEEGFREGEQTAEKVGEDKAVAALLELVGRATGVTASAHNGSPPRLGSVDGDGAATKRGLKPPPTPLGLTRGLRGLSGERASIRFTESSDSCLCMSCCSECSSSGGGPEQCTSRRRTGVGGVCCLADRSIR